MVGMIKPGQRGVQIKLKFPSKWWNYWTAISLFSWAGISSGSGSDWAFSFYFSSGVMLLPWRGQTHSWAGLSQLSFWSSVMCMGSGDCTVWAVRGWMNLLEVLNLHGRPRPKVSTVI